jgi:hypothetical protein
MEKNNFETLAENRTEILKRLIMDDDLAKCLLNKSEMFKDTTVTPIDKAKLMYVQVFPFAKTTGTLDSTKSYITMSFKYRKVKGANIFKTASITIYAFCHEDIAKTPYGILRSDYMIQQVDRLLNNTRSEGWIGRLSLDNMSDVIFDNGYVGLSVTYVDTEFQ